MEINENIAGLGKNHDRGAQENDIPKKQSQATPAAENLDMMPNSVNKDGGQEFKAPIHQEAEQYTKDEHQKAEDWENHGDT